MVSPGDRSFSPSVLIRDHERFFARTCVRRESTSPQRVDVLTAIIIGSAASTRDGSASAANQVLILALGSLAAILLAGLITWGAKRSLRFVSRIADNVETMTRNFDSVMNALLGEKPSKLNPYPPPGALAIIRKHGNLIESHDRTLGVVLVALKTTVEQRQAERDGNGHDLTPSDTIRLINEEQNRRVNEHLDQARKEGA